MILTWTNAIEQQYKQDLLLLIGSAPQWTMTRPHSLPSNLSAYPISCICDGNQNPPCAPSVPSRPALPRRWSHRNCTSGSTSTSQYNDPHARAVSHQILQDHQVDYRSDRAKYTDGSDSRKKRVSQRLKYVKSTLRPEFLTRQWSWWKPSIIPAKPPPFSSSTRW